MRHPGADHALEHVKRAFDSRDVTSGKRDDLGGERGDAPAAAFLEQSGTIGRGTHDGHAAIGLARGAEGEAEAFEFGDDARDRRRAHLFGVGELAEREGPAEDYDRESRELRRGESCAGVLPPYAPQQVDGRGMEAVGCLQRGAAGRRARHGPAGGGRLRSGGAG